MMKGKEKWSYRLLLQKLKSSVKRVIYPSTSHQYLFILSPPYCGSTLLTEIIDSSDSSSINNNIGTYEGQRIPEVENEMFHNPDKWDPKHKLNWQRIKQVWHSYWDPTKPLLVDKSPPNILRASRIEMFFDPSHFIIFVRNPYAQVESLMRRDQMQAKEAAEFAMKCLEHQKKNLDLLENRFFLRYEDLVENPQQVIKDLNSALPGDHNFHLKGSFSTHNKFQSNQPIFNTNSKKIKSLNSNNLHIINSIFQKKVELLEFFDYHLI